MRLIDKDAVLAAIDKLYQPHTCKEYTDETGCVLEDLETFIESLEVKTFLTDRENIKDEIQKYLDEYFYGEYAPYDKVRAMAIHFFELGLNYNKKGHGGLTTRQ